MTHEKNLVADIKQIPSSKPRAKTGSIRLASIGYTLAIETDRQMHIQLIA